MQKMWILLILLCCVGSLSAKERKTVFIIVDGIPADVIERVNTPAIDEIAARGGYTRAYMGGKVDGYSQTPTVSAVCYNTLLTATWVNKHNVWGNDISAPDYNYWNVFRIAKNQKKDVTTAIYSSWEDNRTKLIGEGLEQAGGVKMDYAFDGLEKQKELYPAEKHSLEIFKIDEKVSEEAAAGIRKNAPDLTWVYLWYLDCVGHEQGDGESFDKYTALADRQVARIWEAVKYREKKCGEEWMIVVLTDHGRKTGGYGHGGQTERERTVWVSTNVKTNVYFSEQQPATVDVVPSICRFMDFTIPVELKREQDGIPFIGKVDISNADAVKEGKQITLTWKSYETNPFATIYAATKNEYSKGSKDEWVKVGRVKAKDNRFVFDTEKSPSDFYKFAIETPNNTLSIWMK